jgi:mono/diheme cytochrome c family protein
MRAPQLSTWRTGTRGLLIIGLPVACLALVLWIAVGAYRRPVPADEGETARSVAPIEEQPLVMGKPLYANYCAACHGDTGDGNGAAAKYLNPKPRNFGEGKFRLVSTVNRLPTDQDLLRVLERGMPGSAMFPFAHLSEKERQALVVYVRSLMETAFAERFRHDAAARGEEINAEELAHDVREVLQPGAPFEVAADFPPASDAAVARGRELYAIQCAPCHGTTGKGDGAQDQRNDDGTPTRPRDFSRGIFKGGREHRQLYTRIMLGMPGSPMPSSMANMKPSEANDLIHFVLSLSDATAQAKLEHRRTHLVARRSVSAPPDAVSDTLWQAAQPSHIVVSPLWWRDYEEPDLHVQALHDGRTLAIRLTWQDSTRNDSAVRPQDFEDMAPVQLFKGSPEPFLGMGSADQNVDVWHWRAGWRGDAAAYADVDSAYPNMAVDLYPFEKPGPGPRPHAPERQPREYITARAAGNLRSDPSLAFTGNSLGAKGFGSLTMRPRVSQLVSASGTWQDGRWTVVLRRPLEVNSDDGIRMAAGDQVSIAFAICDGAARDRNGQKLVSIWHDLRLE